jgi:hypothetical protein
MSSKNGWLTAVAADLAAAACADHALRAVPTANTNGSAAAGHVMPFVRLQDLVVLPALLCAKLLLSMRMGLPGAVVHELRRDREDLWGRAFHLHRRFISCFGVFFRVGKTIDT